MFQYFTATPEPYSTQAVRVFEDGGCYAQFGTVRDYATMALYTYPTIDGVTFFDSSHPDYERVEFPVANIAIANRILSILRVSGAAVAPF